MREQVFLEKGVEMNYLIRKCLYMTLCLAFCISAGQLHGQVIYRITGFANNIGGGFGNAPEVAPGETYVAEFEIDLSVEDSDSSPDRGVYSGAIVSSSIEFEGGTFLRLILPVAKLLSSGTMLVAGSFSMT